LYCLPDRLGATIVAVADVLGMEGPSATVLSEAGSARELSDCASEAHNKLKDASSVTALTAVTMSSCSGMDNLLVELWRNVDMHIDNCLPDNVNRYVNTLCL